MEEKKVKKEELNEEDLKQATGGIYEQAGDAKGEDRVRCIRHAHLRPVEKRKKI